MDSRPILVVNDTPDDVALTLRALHQSHIDHEVVVARDGVEALDYLHGTGAFVGRDARLQPALMLLDLNLPRLSGLNVLRRMQADPDLSQIRVVVLTSSREDEDIVASYAHGACSYVRKPVGFHEFLATVRRLSEYWLTLNEPVPCGPSA
ncbi:MAG: response regulator [Planctomycetaceae bacterium]|nr:response regulator [Planctomycetaceae bacterium]